MSPEIIQAPFSYPRSRPRAATDKTRATRTFSPPSSAMNPPTTSMCRSPDAVSQTSEVSDHVRARAASGSLRHPTPLSLSDIHSILEQEQEAMVNRLSRELSLLRHRTASITSTTSSTSATLNDPLDTLHISSYKPGLIYPTPSQRPRSSSSLSGSYFPVVQGSRAGGRSRRPSFASSQRSQSLVSVTSQPQERKRDPSVHVAHSLRFYSRRSSVSQRIPSGSGIGRLDETALSRKDVESLVHENEVLRRRIRDLELELSVQKNPAHKSSDQGS
ncbi:hypothetical protein BDW59DRAFT_137656 [Aspergillus cavernicola]|uniref:Uncharacterized protein n=1 Tax=Aspergillus cavernicola TaxID=176166 RepID=A0ABR4J2M8_9EURO